MRVLPHRDFAGCPPLDALLVPGGKGTREQVNNAALLDFVRTQAAGAQAMLSVCTGSFVLQAAGLLAGRSATTYWSLLPALRELGVPVQEQRFVHDDPVWTSAGVSAGTDMMLAYIAHVAGDDAAGKVQLSAEYYPAATRYGRQAEDPRAPAYVRAG
jgi:transcriptional regulator GlxA family with amidase domain